MLNLMRQAKNAIAAQEAALKIITSNIANMDTTGYKRLDISFQSIFEQILNRGSAAGSTNNLGGTNPIQLGQGMGIADLKVDFSQGDLASGSNLDLAISGQGLFAVSDDGGTTFKYTRSGDFSINSAGNLVTSTGAQVYGFFGTGTSLIPITGLSSALYNTNNLSFDSAGSLLEYTDDTFTSVQADTGFRIALTYFNNPGGLIQSAGSTFEETDASGAPAAAALPGGAAGSVTARYTESSNVFYLSESLKSLEIQRAMNGNLTMIRLASDIISNFISRLG
ncbi:MAG: flagellar hook basal-body protein [Candidatus Margulisbacteria bacterium]|nr:flagellar hook basal-body protein [Candidatus Margulisiibacteriota bacterium]MBU1021179.1 flagellar hook basal-body protein [Candidatus Margulisiibacteriota bacterium]MBU1729785.1 flagellar hook basal-body protein [Candidatus Margulisiibacteriota bacterium]MBU1955286.1 flagellar hook basal-body protein [Candidatus Margulisiibacteriota bacterium]